MPRKWLLLGAALGVALAAPAAVAQRGAVSVQGVVLQPPLTAAGSRTLQFGFVQPGVNRAVLPREPSGGELRIDGITFRNQLQISFALPASLARVGGGAEMAVHWNGLYAGGCENVGNQCVESTYQRWNPVTTPTYTVRATRYTRWWHYLLGPHFESEYSIYLGGEARPTAGLPAGSYAGVVNVTIVATGL